MKIIKLSRLRVALVDDKDYGKINQNKWSYDKDGYAKRTVVVSREVRNIADRYRPYMFKKFAVLSKYKSLYLHHVILPMKKGFLVDHINGKKFDNRRCNLRYVRIGENQKNRHPGLMRECTKNIAPPEKMGARMKRFWEDVRTGFSSPIAVNDI